MFRIHSIYFVLIALIATPASGYDFRPIAPAAAASCACSLGGECKCGEFCNCPAGPQNFATVDRDYDFQPVSVFVPVPGPPSPTQAPSPVQKAPTQKMQVEAPPMAPVETTVRLTTRMKTTTARTRTRTRLRDWRPFAAFRNAKFSRCSGGRCRLN